MENWVTGCLGGGHYAYQYERMSPLTGQFGALKEQRNLFLVLILFIFNSQYKFHLQPFQDPSIHREINRVMGSSVVNFLYK